MMLTILASVLIVILFFSFYKIGYLTSEIKFCKMVRNMIDQIDPKSPMGMYNIAFIEILQDEFEEKRGK